MYTYTFIFNTKKILLGCIFLIVSNILYAQNNETINNAPNNNWSINLNGGSTQYWGFINNKNFSNSLKHRPTWGYGLVLARQITPEFGIRGQFLMGKIKGRNDVMNEVPPTNLVYFSDFIEGNITAKISLTDMIIGHKPNRTLNVYGLLGLGITNFQGETINQYTFETVHLYGHGSGNGIKGYELEGLGTFGIGLSVKLSNALDFTFENAMKFINTNKLDAKKGIINTDSYGYSSFGLSYNFRLKKETKKAPVAKQIIQEQPKPIIVEKKPVEVKEEVVVVPAPVKIEQKAVPVEKVKQPEVKPVKKVELFSGYTVQILSTLNPTPFDNIVKKYKLTEQIREDQSAKWYRYSIGEFRTFKEAKAFSKRLFTRNKFKDAFIVKFEDGKRVGQVWK